MGGFVGLGMARTHGETAIAEFRQHLANRAFVQHDAEAPFQLVTQIHTSPANHTVTSRIGTRFHQPGQIGRLFGGKLRPSTRPLQVV
jgi:hypothetical protein